MTPNQNMWNHLGSWGRLKETTMTYMMKIFILLVLIIILSIALISLPSALKNRSTDWRQGILTGSIEKSQSQPIFPNIFYNSTSKLRIYFRRVEQSRLGDRKGKTDSGYGHQQYRPWYSDAFDYRFRLHPTIDKSLPEDKLETYKNSPASWFSSKRLEALLEYRRLMEGAVKPKLEEVDFQLYHQKSSDLLWCFSGGKYHAWF